MEWRVIEYAVADPAWNMAVDEAIFLSYLEGAAPPTIRFYGWNPPTLSVGYFQDIQREVNLDWLQARGFGLVRRTTGGRAVLHDRELTYSVIAGTRHDLPDGLRDSYLYISQALVAAFEQFGVTATLHQGSVPKASLTGACFEAPSWYELTVNSRKLVGSAQFRKDGSFLQHGSILIEFSPADLASLLNFSEEHQVFCRAIAAKVTSFAELNKPVAPEPLATAILNAFTELYGIQFRVAGLTEAELAIARELVLQKYGNEEWNLRRGQSRNDPRLNAGGRNA